jgi:hypothetical protein
MHLRAQISHFFSCMGFFTEIKEKILADKRLAMGRLENI